MSISPRWRHQEEAFEFARSLFARKQNGCMLAMAMGCVSGDAEIIVNRGGNARRMNLRDLYSKFHGGTWNPEIPSRTRSLINGELRLNCILNVIHQGVQPVLKISLASGKWIRVTSDHEIAMPNEAWCRAAALKPGMEILTNGQAACQLCGSTEQVILSHSAKYRGLCKRCAYHQRPQRLPPLTLSSENIPACHNCGSTKRVAAGRGARHRGLCMACIYSQRPKTKRAKEKVIDKDGYVRLYGRWDHPRHNKAGQVYEHIVVMEKFLGRSITNEEHVHHKDQIRHHNDPTNLEVLPGPGHSWHHGKEGGYLRLNSAPKVCFVPRIDTVISVEPNGESDVYDLIMGDPGHNFIANSVIVHNCGKSRVAIDLALAEKIEQLLIVCPLRVVSVWEQQLTRFAPGHFHFLALDERAGSVHAKYEDARQLYQWSQEHHHPIAIAINYDSARVEPFSEWAANRIWGMVIADEIHRCKEPRGLTSTWLAKVGLMAHRRLGLTGTPMPHMPIDIWAQFRFLNPFHLDRSYWQFKSRYAILGGYFQKEIVGWRNQDELKARFRELAFRVDESVLDLPPEMDETRSVNMGKEGTRIYRQMEREMITWIGEQTEVTAANALVRLLRLAQITGGSMEDETGKLQIFDHAKQDLLEDLLKDLREPVVVFCRFKADLEAVHRAAEKAELGSLELSGARDELNSWQKQEGWPFVLAVQIQAGGVGVDLTRARVAIYYSLDFSLANYLQSRARIRRPPQARPCVFYFLQAKNTIDEYILRAIQARRDLVESTLGEQDLVKPILEELKKKRST